VFQRQGRFDEAVDTFQRSMAIEEQLDNRRGQAMVLNSLGGVFQRQGRFEEAVEALQRSYAIQEQLGDMRGQAMVLTSLGGAFQRQGSNIKAVAVLRSAAALAEQLEDALGQAMAYTMLGKALLASGAAEQAVLELTKGFQMDETLKNVHGLEKVTPILVQALSSLGQEALAIEYSQRALALAPGSKHIGQLRTQLALSERSAPYSQALRGTVKLFARHQKGYLYGFIAPDSNGDNIYFREGFVDPKCLTKLAIGVRVEVEVEPSRKGLRAKRLRLIE
jgi:tetratricopeptide (TPR) repeat protein